MNYDYKNTSNRETIRNSGDGDDDKIIFNVKKLFEEAIKKNTEREIYEWAKIEGYKAETNGDIIVDEELRLTKKN